MAAWEIGHSHVPEGLVEREPTETFMGWEEAAEAWRAMVLDFASTDDEEGYAGLDEHAGEDDLPNMEADVRSFLSDGRPMVPGEPYEESFETHEGHRRVFWLQQSKEASGIPKIARVTGTITYEDGATAEFTVLHTDTTGTFFRQEHGEQEVNGRGVYVLESLVEAVNRQRNGEEDSK